MTVPVFLQAFFRTYDYPNVYHNTTERMMSNGQATGGLAADANLGWKGAEKYVAVAPQKSADR